MRSKFIKRSLEMTKKKIDAKYYEETDFSELMSSRKSCKVVRPANKRITLNISQDIYSEAHVLDEFMNMGYQNVLKAAMTLGLEQLNKTISDSKKVSLKLQKRSA
jgi:hypothetical protein